MKETVIPKAIVDEAIKANGLPSVGKASIREVKKLINDIEKASGTRFVRMEMGIPGLPAASDGQMLFLLTAISKMKEPKDGGSQFPVLPRTSSTSTSTPPAASPLWDPCKEASPLSLP